MNETASIIEVQSLGMEETNNLFWRNVLSVCYEKRPAVI